MDARHHDLVLAITSHVPHLIAYNIVGTADDLETVTESEVIKYSAGGFRDFTRIAASDPTMWRDVFLNNREAVLEVLGRFSEDLSALQRAIRWGDGEALFNLFTRTRAIRRSHHRCGPGHGGSRISAAARRHLNKAGPACRRVRRSMTIRSQAQDRIGMARGVGAPVEECAGQPAIGAARQMSTACCRSGEIRRSRSPERLAGDGLRPASAGRSR